MNYQVVSKSILRTGKIENGFAGNIAKIGDFLWILWNT